MLVNTERLFATVKKLMPMISDAGAINWLIFAGGHVAHRRRYNEKYSSGEIISMSNEHCGKLINALMELARKNNDSIAVDEIFFNSPTRKKTEDKQSKEPPKRTSEIEITLKEILSVLIDIKTQLHVGNVKLEKLVDAWDEGRK